MTGKERGKRAVSVDTRAPFALSLRPSTAHLSRSLARSLSRARAHSLSPTHAHAHAHLPSPPSLSVQPLNLRPSVSLSCTLPVSLSRRAASPRPLKPRKPKLPWLLRLLLPHLLHCLQNNKTQNEMKMNKTHYIIVWKVSATSTAVQDYV